MRFIETELQGAYLLELERREDERGFFARAWCRRELEAQGLDTRVSQCNVSFNERQGTLRGMHYQRAPFAETKLIRCTRGAIFDVIIDLRRDSSTYRQWLGAELTADNDRMLYVPDGFAHGYVTLVDETETFYWVSEFYEPDSEGGVRWNDPAFEVQWPVTPVVISDKDRDWPDFSP